MENHKKKKNKIKSQMQTIVITPNRKHENLIPSTKIIQSPTVDMVSVVETEVFLNQHRNICFYLLKDNFDYHNQIGCPILIAKYLLDRDEGPVDLAISNGMFFTIEAHTDTSDIQSTLQKELEVDPSQIYEPTLFTLKFRNSQIKIVIFQEPLYEHRIKQAISEIECQFFNLSQNQQSNAKSNLSGRNIKNQPSSVSNLNGNSSSNLNPNSYSVYNSESILQQQHQQISKIVLFIDDSNYEQFQAWSQNEVDFLDLEIYEKLSHEYLVLKQEIQNQKAGFRNKIKMVETILGESIFVQKLLNQDKEENQEYKRLRDTFETIKNIDNVLIDQERKLEARRTELKEKRAEKQRNHYENAQKFVKKKTQINLLTKEVELLKYNIKRVNQIKEDFNIRTNFEVSEKVRHAVQAEVDKYRRVVCNMGTASAYRAAIGPRREGAVSLHSAEHRRKIQFKKRLEIKAEAFQKLQKDREIQESELSKLESEISAHEQLLSKLASDSKTKTKILLQLKQQIPSFNHTNSPNPPELLSTPHSWPSQFIILNQLLHNSQEYRAYMLKNKENQCQTKGSCKSINMIIDQEKVSKNNGFGVFGKNREAGSVATAKKLTKTKMSFTFEEGVRKQAR